MASIKSKRPLSITLRDIISIHFPKFQVIRIYSLMDPDEIREVTTEDVLKAAEKIVENKAESLDGIPRTTG